MVPLVRGISPPKKGLKNGAQALKIVRLRPNLGSKRDSNYPLIPVHLGKICLALPTIDRAEVPRETKKNQYPDAIV